MAITNKTGRERNQSANGLREIVRETDRWQFGKVRIVPKPIDYVLDDARRLRPKLGRDDQFKMDEYLDSIRAVEKRIEFASQEKPRDWQPSISEAEIANAKPGIPADFRQHIEIMMDLMVLAFQTDSTRVCFVYVCERRFREKFFFLGRRSGWAS